VSPEKRHSLTLIARLQREISHDREAIVSHEQDAADLIADAPRLSTDRSARAHAAVVVHAWYTGLETLLERVARHLDGEVPTGDASHRDLLFQCSAEIPGIRPAVLPTSVTSPLSELLAFRHFFRHAYAVELDPKRLATLMTILLETAPVIHAALDAFNLFLVEASQALQAP
jgi:hypothetical protein